MVDGMTVSPTVKAECNATIKAFEYVGLGFRLIKTAEKFIFEFKISVPGRQ